MSQIPGAQFNITGASGSQAALTARSGWFAYVLPRGGFASQDSTGTQITFDSTDIAGRFAALDWIQAGLLTANIRQVAAVGGNSLTVTGAALTVTENQRIFIIGRTEPTVTGGSATYTTPATFIRQRDDDTSDLYTDSRVTTNSDGLVQFFSVPAVYDVLIQDGNRSLQGYIADLPVGLAEGISTSQASVFGATVTINANLGVTGTVTLIGGVTVTGQVNIGGGTLNLLRSNPALAALGVTGTALFNSRVAFGNSVSIDGALGVTGTITGTTVVAVGVYGTSDAHFRRFSATRAGAVVAGDFTITTLGRWGSTASVSGVAAGSVDQAGEVQISPNGATFEFAPTTTFTFHDGSWGSGVTPRGVITCVRLNDYAPIGVAISASSDTSISWITGVTPSAGQIYAFTWSLFGAT